MNLINILTYNPGLFDGIQLPEALSQEDVVNEILQECATMEPLYGDPNLFHQMIIQWFKTRNYTFQRLYDSMFLEYNPLENAYRTETRETGYTRDYSRDASRDGSETEETGSKGTTDTSSNGSKDTSSNGSKDIGSTQKTTSETTATSKDQVAPYNDENFHDTTQTTGNNTANGSVENSGNENFENTGNEQFENSGNEQFENSGNRELSTKNSETISDNENGKTLDNFTLKGSIGLITPQQMIEQERNVVKFNLYGYIATEFSKRFMIQVY